MNHQAKEYARLNEHLEWCQASLAKAFYIIIFQQKEFICPGIRLFRESYIHVLIKESCQLRKQIDDLLDQIDIKEIVSVLQE